MLDLNGNEIAVLFENLLKNLWGSIIPIKPSRIKNHLHGFLGYCFVNVDFWRVCNPYLWLVGVAVCGGFTSLATPISFFPS